MRSSGSVWSRHFPWVDFCYVPACYASERAAARQELRCDLCRAYAQAAAFPGGGTNSINIVLQRTNDDALPARLQRAYARTDQNRAATAMAIGAVPSQPSTTSDRLARNRPISFVFEAMAIIIAMMGTATMPLSTAPPDQDVDGVESGEAEHGNGQQSRADDAERKQQEGEAGRA